MRVHVEDVPEWVKEKAKEIYETFDSSGLSGSSYIVPWMDESRIGEVEVRIIDGAQTYFVFEPDQKLCLVCKDETIEDVCPSCSETIIVPVVKEVMKKVVCDLIDKLKL